MTSVVNRILRGNKASYRVLEILKEPSVFKAITIKSPSCTSSNSENPQDLVVIKDLLFERELGTHQVPAIQACPYIRQVVDIVEEEAGTQIDVNTQPRPRLVFEWMDTDLWQARPYGRATSPIIAKTIARSVLEALAVFQNLSAVHTDVNPNNVFLSKLDQAIPITKLGDLDQAVMEGIKDPNAQSLETRAPEVWRGLGVWPVSDVWSLGVTMVHWLLSKSLFGRRGKIIEGHMNAWCIAKIWKLIGPVGPPENANDVAEFKLAHGLAYSQFKNPKTGAMIPYIPVRSLQEELEELPHDLCSIECIDFIKHLLIVDHTKRPNAQEALRHAFVKDIAS